jgi:hypothetical protein
MTPQTISDLRLNFALDSAAEAADDELCTKTFLSARPEQFYVYYCIRRILQALSLFINRLRMIILLLLGGLKRSCVQADFLTYCSLFAGSRVRARIDALYCAVGWQPTRSFLSRQTAAGIMRSGAAAKQSKAKLSPFAAVYVYMVRRRLVQGGNIQRSFGTW